ncbi:MAG: undecaprenyl-diphosphate phosphatase [Chromatiales bacterium]|jgi:undecaprenyl-diphosphatase
MELIQIIILSLVQGLTEFLPISSSAHLILSPYLFGFADQGMAFDVAVHIGSLGAVMLYFRRQIFEIVPGMFSPKNSQHAADGRLGWFVALATLPVMLTGLLFHQHVETDLRSPFVIAITTVGFGLLLLAADMNASRSRDEYSMNWRDVLIIGLFQAMAIVPGTSRSGITMTAGLMLGLTREASTRFSFLLSIPTILMSGTLVTYELLQADVAVHWQDLITGIAISFVAAYLCIHFFLKFIEKIGMIPFVVYRLALGGVLFWLLYQ